MLRLPPVIGHRGAASVAPENTLAGLRAAAEAGAGWVEFDVRLSADGVCVLVHDPSLRRTGGWRRAVAALTAAEIRSVSAGAWFGADFAEERVPTLAEALALVEALGLGADIEVKAEPRARPARIALLCDALAETLGRSALPGRGACMVSSFDQRLLRRVVDGGLGAPVALNLRHVGRGWRRAAEALGCAAIACDARQLDRHALAELAAAGLPVAAFTVNRLDTARRLWRAGVAAIISDRPGALLPAAPSSTGWGVVDRRRPSI